MPFQLSLYRAIEGLGPLITWDREHRQSLGSKVEVRQALDRLLPGLCWSESGELLVASGPFDGEEHALELSLLGGTGEQLLDLQIYASPPAIRVIMTALGLNYCYAVDSCELRDPFGAGDRWTVAAR